MTQETVEKVLGRMLTDDAFRCRTKESLYATCLDEGYLLSKEELRLIGRLDLLEPDSISESLDSGIKRFSPGNKDIPEMS